MKIFARFILLFVLSTSVFASPLIFKAEKEFDETGFYELATFDATKYKQIRIQIQPLSLTDYKYTSIFAVEDKMNIRILESEATSYVLDSPPPKVMVQIYGKGKYRLYVWGE